MADKNGDKWEVVGSSKPTKTKGKLAPVTNGSGKNSAAAKPMLKVEELSKLIKLPSFFIVVRIWYQ